MIKKENIKRGVGAIALISFLRSGEGLVFYNGDYVKHAGYLAQEKVIPVQNLEQNPIWVAPVRIELENQVALKVPYGYGIYCLDESPQGIMLGVHEDEEEKTVTFTGPDGNPMENYIGVKEDVKKLLQFEDTYKKVINEGKVDRELFIELEKRYDEEKGTVSLVVPYGYGIYYAGYFKDALGMWQVSYELDGEDVTMRVRENKSEWDYVLLTANINHGTVGYVGVPLERSKELNKARSLRYEMEKFYNGLQEKNFN